MIKKKIDVNPLNAIPSILMLILGFVAIWFIAKTVFKILAIAAPILLIIAAFIRPKVVTDYVKMIVNLLRNNTIMGVIATILTVVFYPVVCFFLFGKALLLRKVGKFKEDLETRRKGEFVEYEEVEDIRPEKPTIVELPPLREKPKAQRGNNYEDLFEE